MRAQITPKIVPTRTASVKWPILTRKLVALEAVYKKASKNPNEIISPYQCMGKLPIQNAIGLTLKLKPNPGKFTV